MKQRLLGNTLPVSAIAQGCMRLADAKETPDRVLGTAAAYTYLGSARYVSHEGSRPMSITWELDRPIPAKYLRKTNQLTVG